MQETCYQYWPTWGMVQFREYTVDILEEKPVRGFIVRTLVVTNEKVTNFTCMVRHLHPVSCEHTIAGQEPPGGSVAGDQLESPWQLL